MALQIFCPTCGATLEVDEAAAGRNVVCPGCAAELIVPGEGTKPVDTAEPPRASRAPDQRPMVVRRSSKRAKVEDEDDERPSRRRSRRIRCGFRCPYCGSTDYPMRRSQISPAGWVVFALMLLICWPLFFIGLMMKEDYSVCADCGLKVGG